MAVKRRAAPPSGKSTSRRARRGCLPPGLRNPNGMAWEPRTGALWTVANERDELGNDLVPDYLTSVKEGVVLRLAVLVLRTACRRARRVRRGRTWCASAVRARLRAGRARRGARARVLATARRCRSTLTNGMFVGEHGSWNRKPPAGYKVVFIPFVNGKPVGHADRRAHRIREQGRRGLGPARGRRHRQARRAARGR